MNLTLHTTTSGENITAEAVKHESENTSLILRSRGLFNVLQIIDGTPGAFDRFERIAAIFNEPNSTAAEKSSDDFDVSMSR